MIELHLPWLELAILLPLVGALWVSRVPEADRVRQISLAISFLSLICTLGAWIDFGFLHVFVAHDHWDMFASLTGKEFFVIDEFSSPLLPLVALLFFLTQLATTRGKARRFSFAWALLGQATMLATFSCIAPWGIIAFLTIGTLPPWLELRWRSKPTRVYEIHMGLFIVLLIFGWSLIVSYDHGPWRTLGMVCLVAAVLIRSGVAPLHCWMTDLFEHATFGNSLLFVTPMVGAYAAMRLVLPIVPDAALHTISILSLATALYAAGMSLVQREARRFFCFIFLSHSSLVLVGLETATELGLAAALLVWVSVSISLTGFGLTLRSVEARTGRLLLTEYRGLGDQVPQLAACFLLTGLASVGFPGTSGFIATELLIEAAIDRSSLYGVIVVLAAALNGIAVLFVYFRVFTGTRHQATVSLRGRLPEQIAVLTLFVLIIVGGLIPQPGVASRYNAASALLKQRSVQMAAAAQQQN
ncbi:MAG: oxidoreductase [Pirellulaceae bacterium]|nr:oxidoreductase [Pirellulaceae bacterium]